MVCSVSLLTALETLLALADAVGDSMDGRAGRVGRCNVSGRRGFLGCIGGGMSKAAVELEPECVGVDS